MKRQMVERLIMEGEPLKVALEAVGMAKSSYYYRSAGRRKPRALDEALVRAINEVRQGHAGVYGYRKITMALRAAGWTVNTRKVLWHLRASGLTQPKKLKGQRWSRPAIIRPSACNMYWEADLTCVWTGNAMPTCLR